MTNAEKRFVMWTWEQIEREWLAGEMIAVRPDEAVHAFNRVEAILGQDWMKGCRGSSGVASGTSPTLSVVNMGQWLGILHGIANTDPLLDKIRRRDESAAAELVGLYLIRSG